MTTAGPTADLPVDSGGAPDPPPENLSPGTPTDGPDRPRPRRMRQLLLPVLVVLGVALIVALAPVATIAARRLPLPPGDPTPIVAGTTRPGTTTMRSLPIGLPPGITIATTDDLWPYADAALGVSGTEAFMAMLSSPNYIMPDGSYPQPYPYRFAPLEPILDAAPPAGLRSGAIPLAAALITLAGQPGFDDGIAASKVAQLAYAVLDRTRASGGCDAQLDLLLLLAGDPLTRPEILADEHRSTVAACPTEPTPSWLVGQAKMRDLGVPETPRPTYTSPDLDAVLTSVITTFQDLTKRFPRDTAAVTGLGDAYLRAGLERLYSQPFTARHDLRLAVAQYNRAAELGAAHDADLGRARALVALGEAEQAVPIATRLVAHSPRPGGALEVLLGAAEGAHDFARAETVADQLDQAGPDAYPAATAFYPAPRNSDAVDSVADASRPLSMGAETLTPLQDTLIPPGGAGGTVTDLSFIPLYRDDTGVTGAMTRCPSLASRRDAILAGHAERALDSWPAEFTGARPGTETVSCAPGYGNLQSVAQLVAQWPISDTTDTKDELTDKWQNLLRWAGNLTKARQVISKWEASVGERSALPALRLGEVDFLRHDYNEAAGYFEVAARRARKLHYDDELGVDQAQLNRGAALFAAGRNLEAVTLLRPLVDLGTWEYAYLTSKKDTDAADSFAAISYYAAEQLADYESANNDLHAAVEDYHTALSWTDELGFQLRPEVLNNNLALAELGLGATATAGSFESKALASDPMDPAFLMTAGFIADRGGKIAEAVDYDQRTLQSDPGAFPAANDLGVELARQHHDTAAVTALRQAIGANPGYALGWFNLGVLEGRRGPLHVPASQGAFAKAFALDPTLKDRRHELTIDASVYRTALDLSKPLPPRWSLADTQKALPVATAGLLAALLLAVGLARSASPGGPDLAKQWLEPLGERLDGIRGLTRLRYPLWAVAATVVTFLLTYLRRAGSPSEIAAYALGVLVLTGAAMCARLAVASRAKVSTTQSSWLPGLAFGIGTGAIGLPWAPLPVVKTSPESTRVHLAAPLTLAGLCLVLFAESAWLGVPLTQSFAIVALVMAGSTLLPIAPLDGAHVGKAGVAAAAGVIGGAILIVLGII